MLRFAARHGFTPRLLEYRKALAGYGALQPPSVGMCALHPLGEPLVIAEWFLVPFVIFVGVGLLGFVPLTATSKVWYSSPAPGQRSMLTMWPKWGILRPDKRIDGNWLAEPQGEGVGGPLLKAELADVDRRRIWIYGPPTTTYSSSTSGRGFRAHPI